MTNIQKFKIAQKFSPTDSIPEQCDERRFTTFVTEDASGGDVTPLVFTESQWDKACAAFLAVIISGLLIDFGYWFWRL